MSDAEDQQRWQVCVRAGNDWRTAAMQVLDDQGITTIVLWGTPEDVGSDVVLDVNLHTNVTADGDGKRLGEALALYLEAVVHAIRAGHTAADEDPPVVVAGAPGAFKTASDA